VAAREGRSIKLPLFFLFARIVRLPTSSPAAGAAAATSPPPHVYLLQRRGFTLTYKVEAVVA
jgi:hypothetical protein